MKNHDVITNEKNFYDQPVDAGIERYKEIKLRGNTKKQQNKVKIILHDFYCIINKSKILID